MPLIKFRTIEFQRIDEDHFMVQLLDRKGAIVATLEPREVLEGEKYIVLMGNDNVAKRENLPEY